MPSTTHIIEILDDRYLPAEAAARESEFHFTLTRDADGQLVGAKWVYGTDLSLEREAKKRGASWSGTWMFALPRVAEEFFVYARNKHPDWPVRDVGWQARLFAGVTISAVQAIGHGLAACTLALPVPLITVPKSAGGVRVFFVSADPRPRLVIVGLEEAVASLCERMTKKGSVIDAAPMTFATSVVQVHVDGWAVKIRLDPADPRHLWWLAPTQRNRWIGAYPHGTLQPIPWDGIGRATRKTWGEWRDPMAEAGIEWTGDDPSQEFGAATDFDSSAVPGWVEPAPNGNLLHAYPKGGARFCAGRGMRALIGDEMGVGKTAQAIAAAEGTRARRVFVVCPANARYVWDREIRGWASGGRIQHIASQIDSLDSTARWHILTYDQIAARAEVWKLRDRTEAEAFALALPDRAKEVLEGAKGKFPVTVRIASYVPQTPAFAPERSAAWQKMMRRLRGDLVEQIVTADGEPLLILDEAHRVKNRDAKRTAAAQRLADAVPGLLMLTGTPLRNNEQEAKVLLSIIDRGVRESLGRHYTLRDIKDALSYFMIRRTKSEVLPELPEKTRQRVEVGNLDSDEMEKYDRALKYAFDTYAAARARGDSPRAARRAMLGGLEMARSALGSAKVAGGDVEDLVQDVVENQGCVVVFCAHHAVSDALLDRLSRKPLKAATLDGRTSQIDRARLTAAFQDGRLDVLIGGINAAGEAITLTRASTVIFVELDWVPAALLQAEDRIHRVGQRANCQIIHLTARTNGGINLDDMMIATLARKMETINAVLDEGRGELVKGYQGKSQSIQQEIVAAVLGQREPLAAHQAEVTSLPVEVESRAEAQNDDLAPTIIDAAAFRSGGTQRLLPRQITSAEADESTHLALESASSEAEGESAAGPVKRRRGRPKIYGEGHPAPTAGERSRRSIQALASAGGKRLMLRLTPEALAALREIMAARGYKEETLAINKILLEAGALADTRRTAQT